MVQAWRNTPLVNPLEADKLRWFSTAYPDVDFKGIPLELAEVLYPEVAAYGPSGLIVMEIFNDVIAMPTKLDSVNTEKANEALDDFEDFVQTLPLFDDEISFFGYRGALDKAIMSLTQQANLDNQGVESILYVLLFWVALDGFCGSGETYDEGLEQIREEYHALLQRFFDLVELESDDYLSLLSPQFEGESDDLH